MFISSTGILKRHDILINLIPYQKIDGQTIERGANLVHDTIGTMSCSKQVYTNAIANMETW